MSSQTRTTGGSRPSKKTNHVSGSAKTVTTVTKKTEHPKTEKEKVHVKVSIDHIFLILNVYLGKRILSSNNIFYEILDKILRNVH